MNDSILDDYRGAFFKECDGLLSTMRASLVALKDKPDDREEIQRAFRAAHNIRGVAGIFGFNDIVDCSRAIESLLDEAVKEKREIHYRSVELLLSSCDFIDQLLHVEQNNETRDKALYEAAEQLVGRIKSLLNNPLPV